MTAYDEIETEPRSALSRIVSLLLFLVVQGVAIAIVGFAALFLSFEPVWSAQGLPAALVKPADARTGSLLLKTDDGYADATRLGIDVDITVSGPTIRARVTQLFHNPTSNWVEAVYVYPLPEGGAVDTLKMIVGDRVVAFCGERFVMRLSGALIIVGLLAALLIPSPVTAIAGFAVAGLGNSNLVPIFFSAAGRDPVLGPGPGIAVVTTLGFFGFLVGPAVI